MRVWDLQWDRGSGGWRGRHRLACRFVPRAGRGLSAGVWQGVEFVVVEFVCSVWSCGGTGVLVGGRVVVSGLASVFVLAWCWVRSVHLTGAVGRVLVVCLVLVAYMVLVLADMLPAVQSVQLLISL